MSLSSVVANLWQQSLQSLESELPTRQFNTWIRPLHAEITDNNLHLLAPNRFVLDWVRDNYSDLILQIARNILQNNELQLSFAIGSRKKPAQVQAAATTSAPFSASQSTSGSTARSIGSSISGSIQRPTQTAVAPGPRPSIENLSADQKNTTLNVNHTFDNFVEGKSNQLARAAAMQVALNPGTAYNPLFLYGGVGLGKTHLMHAIGNMICQIRPDARVVYLRSETFVADMVKALQHNAINEFKRHYRSVNALLIDDIQFFAGKERSQEEFFHTFNALLEGQQQIILTCDRFPKEVDGLEERLQSRFGWGLTVAIEAPELETRVAILMSKAQQMEACLPSEVAFFIAKRIRSNIRDLEGALRRVIANAHFTGMAITLDFAREALSDLLASQQKQITLENIQKTVAEYYKIRVTDLLSKKRNRSIARPRQLAMALAKELTNHSLPEIGDNFGGRDHTTVLHACRKIAELRKSEPQIDEDYDNLLRTMLN